MVNPFLTNFQILSYKNHICINQSTEDAYLYNTLILGAKNAWCKTIVIHHYRLSTTCWSVAPGWKGSDGPPDPSRPSDFFFFEIGSYRPEATDRKLHFNFLRQLFFLQRMIHAIKKLLLLIKNIPKPKS